MSSHQFDAVGTTLMTSLYDTELLVGLNFADVVYGFDFLFRFFRYKNQIACNAITDRHYFVCFVMCDRDQRQTPAAANLALVLLGNQSDRRRFMISVRKPNLCWAAIRKA